MSTSNIRGTASLLDGVRRELNSVPASPAPKTTEEAGKKPASQLWANIVSRVEGAGEPDADGNPTDMFISLPVGIALDDMKPILVKGTNGKWVHIQQAKNAFLENLQKKLAGFAPGERKIEPGLYVELYRINTAPAQVAETDGSNPFIAGILASLGMKTD